MLYLSCTCFTVSATGRLLGAAPAPAGAAGGPGAVLRIVHPIRMCLLYVAGRGGVVQGSQQAALAMCWTQRNLTMKAVMRLSDISGWQLQGDLCPCLLVVH